MAGAANRLLEDATFVYEYDAEGNTTRQTRKAAAAATDFITEFAWDHRNRLVEVTQKNDSGETTVRVEYDYDVTDHMIGRREFLGNSSTPARSEYFVWDGWNIALILDGASAVVERRFNGDAADQVFASEDALNEVTWLLADHLNTPRDFLDSSGTLLNHRVYDSFGLITSESNSTIGSNIAFTGGYRDTVTNLIYRWHRWYSPHTHRWLSEDWIWAGANPFGYVRNGPLMSSDYTGFVESMFNGAADVAAAPPASLFTADLPDSMFSANPEGLVTQGPTLRPDESETIYKGPIPEGDEGDDQLIADLLGLAADVAGIFDPTPFCDLTSAAIDAHKGEFASAAVTGIAAFFPLAGDFLKLRKLGKLIVVGNKIADRAEAGGELAARAAKWLPKVRDMVNRILEAPFVKSCLPNGVRDGLQTLRSRLDNLLKASNAFSGPVTFGENFAKKVRKHIDQVRNRGPIKEAIPSPGQGGIEAVEKIIRDRIAMGGGRATTFAGEAAVAFEDGGVTYIFRPNGAFWTILGN